MHTCVHIHAWKPNLVLACLPLLSSTSFCNRVTSLNLDSSARLTWPDTLMDGAVPVPLHSVYISTAFVVGWEWPCSPLVPGLYRHSLHVWLLCVCWGFKLKFSGLHSKHFAPQTLQSQTTTSVIFPQVLLEAYKTAEANKPVFMSYLPRAWGKCD